MIVILVILTILFAVLIESLIRWVKNPVDDTIFYNEKVGYTMADGGKKIDKVKDDNTRR